MDRWLDGAPLWIVMLALLLAFLAVREAGAWIGRRLAPSDAEDSERGYILSGILGLLALLIAFTFGLALDRYQTRRDLVVAEANAIGTAEMRVRLLDPPHAARLSRLLGDYAATRLRFGLAVAAERSRLRQASADQRSLIQTETLNALRPVNRTPLLILVAPAINETIDIGAAREAALAARIPTAVIMVLVVYGLVSAGVLGAALHGAGHGHRSMIGPLFLLLTLAIRGDSGPGPGPHRRHHDQRGADGPAREEPASRAAALTQAQVCRSRAGRPRTHCPAGLRRAMYFSKIRNVAAGEWDGSVDAAG